MIFKGNIAACGGDIAFKNDFFGASGAEKVIFKVFFYANA